MTDKVAGPDGSGLSEGLGAGATLLDRLDAARSFPANTCGASRHTEDIGRHLMSSPDARFDEADVQHAGESLCATVCALYEARSELAQWRGLRDPHTLHLNLLRGLPARLSKAQALHLIGDDIERIAEIEAENVRLREALQQADTIMGHDDAATDWRERWALLWPYSAPNARLSRDQQP